MPSFTTGLIRRLYNLYSLYNLPKPLLLLLLVIGSLSSPVLARQRIQGWCELGNKTVTTSGNVSSPLTPIQRTYPSCTVTVYVTGSTSPASIFSNNSNTVLSNPFTASTDGYWFFYADNGRYDIRLSGGGMPAPFTVSDVQLADPFSSGGGGGTVTSVFGRIGVVLAQVGDYSAFYSPLNHNHDTLYAPLSHVHLIADITGLQAILNTTPVVSSSSAAPVGTPAKIGNVHLNVSNTDVYWSTCNTSNSCWHLATSSSSYTLPIASASTLGGIKVGANLAIDGSGVLSSTATGGGGGVANYSIPFSSQATMFVTGATHGLGSSNLISNCYTGTGLFTYVEGYQFIVDPVTFDLSITFPGNITGKCVVSASSGGGGGGGGGGVSAGMGISVAGSVVSVDIGVVPTFLTGSSVIDFGSIAPNTCATNTFTLSGASVGDSVMGGWPADMATGVIPRVLVFSANTISVQLCNVTASAIDPPSRTYGATIVRSF